MRCRGVVTVPVPLKSSLPVLPMRGSEFTQPPFIPGAQQCLPRSSSPSLPHLAGFDLGGGAAVALEPRCPEHAVDVPKGVDTDGRASPEGTTTRSEGDTATPRLCPSLQLFSIGKTGLEGRVWDGPPHQVLVKSP